MSLVVQTAPTVEPLELHEFKKAASIDFGEDDAQAERALKAARRWVEHFTARSLVNRTYDLKLLGWPHCDEIRLPYPPASSVSSVTYYDADNAAQTLATTVYGTDFSCEPARVYLKLGQSWPDLYADTQQVRVVVRYVAGYGAAGTSVPENLLQAVVMAGRDFYWTPTWHVVEQTYRNDAAEALLWSDRFMGEVDGL